MMRDPVAGDFLVEHAGRHTGALKRNVIAAGEGSAHELLDTQLLKDGQFALDHRFQLRPIGPAQAGHFAGTGVVDDAGRNPWHLRFVLFDVSAGAEQALFFAGKQNKADGAFGRRTFGQLPGGFQHHGDALAVVQGPLPQVPRIQMRPQHHDFIGMFRSADFAHGVVNGQRTGDELVGDLDFHAGSGWSWTGGQPIEHGILLMNHGGAGQAVAGTRAIGA